MPDTSPLSDYNAFERDVLLVALGLDEPSGLDIQRRLEDDYDERIYESRLYTALDELRDRGVVENEDVDGRTHAYRVTAEGEAVIYAHWAWVAGLVSKG